MCGLFFIESDMTLGVGGSVYEFQLETEGVRSIGSLRLDSMLCLWAGHVSDSKIPQP